jgi:hypothetical protein
LQRDAVVLEQSTFFSGQDLVHLVVVAARRRAPAVGDGGVGFFPTDLHQ